ncbi:MAG: hypothetical protein QOI61_1937 [Actinomycetota bacterium]|jgi:hypothetical protein
MTTRQKKPRSGWSVLGHVLVGLFAVFGLAAFAFCIFMVMAFNNYGSNK